MNRALILTLLAMVACAPQDDNPLVAASDDQFIKVIGNLPFLGCESALFRNSADPGTKAQRESCERGLQTRAAEAGIPKAVTSAHIADPRVKARYDKLVKRQ